MTKTPRWVIPLSIFILALAVRTFYLFELSHSPLFDTILSAFDHSNFDLGAANFANGDVFASAPNNSYAPLYKYFLGVIYWLFGRNFYLIYYVQFVMGAVASVLVYLIARDLFGVRAGIIAAIGFAFYTPEIIYEGIILRAAFISFWGLLAFYLLSRLIQAPSPGRLTLATLALSLFFQGRPNTLLCLPFVCLFLRHSVFPALAREQRTRHWLVFFGTLALSFFPLLLQAYLVHDRFVLFDASGPHTLISGNIPTYSGVGFNAKIVEEFQAKNGLNFAVDANYIIQQIYEVPLDFIKLYIRKIYFFFNDFEAPTNISIYLYREISTLLPFLWNHFAVFSTLGLVGMVFAVKNRKDCFLLFSFTFALSLGVIIFLNESRYRIPVAPYYIIFAAYAIHQLLIWFSRRRYRDLAVTGVLASIIFFAFLEPKGLQRIRIIDLLNAGTAHLINANAEDDRHGLEYYQRAWELSRSLKPESMRPNLILPFLSGYFDREARKSQRAGDTATEVKMRQKAIFFNYSSASAHHQYAMALFKNGDPQKAFLESLQAVAMQPDSPEFHLFLGVIYAESLKKPLWALYHWQSAYALLPRQGNEPLRRKIKSLQQQHLNIARPERQAVTADDLRQTKSLLKKQLRPLLAFSLDLSLPAETGGWSPEALEQYLLDLYQSFSLSEEANYPAYNYQLGMLYWKKAGRGNAAYYHLEKAWDQGLQFPALANLLNDLSGKLARRPLP